MVRVYKRNIIFLFVYLFIMLSSPKPLDGIYQICYMTFLHSKGVGEQVARLTCY